jgi:hypothetical protein
MYCLTVLTFFLKYLTNANILINGKENVYFKQGKERKPLNETQDALKLYSLKHVIHATMEVN